MAEQNGNNLVLVNLAGGQVDEEELLKSMTRSAYLNLIVGES